jgi:DNA (cytosine-5)-methyltransferase 1
MSRGLVLSLFPGIDILGLGFELEGWCVVRGPDPLFHRLSRIQSFHPPPRFDGIVAGAPCQAHSRLRHMIEANRYRVAPDLIPDFERVVGAARPDWFILECSPASPVPHVAGYNICSQIVSNRTLGEVQDRKRRISFGLLPTWGEPRLKIEERPEPKQYEPAVVADSRPVSIKIGGSGKVKKTAGSVRRSIADCCELQGCPRDLLEGTPFLAQAARRMIANAVPLPMARAIARAVGKALEG